MVVQIIKEVGTNNPRDLFFLSQSFKVLTGKIFIMHILFWGTPKDRWEM